MPGMPFPQAPRIGQFGATAPAFKPARIEWRMKRPDVFVTDVHMGRDLTDCFVSGAMFVGAMTRSPVGLNVQPVDALKGIVRVTIDTDKVQPGVWPWSLGVVRESESIVHYSGAAFVEAE